MDVPYELLPATDKARNEFNERLKNLQDGDLNDVGSTVRELIQMVRTTIEAIAKLEFKILTNSNIITVVLVDDGQAYITNTETGTKTEVFEVQDGAIMFDFEGRISKFVNIADL